MRFQLLVELSQTLIGLQEPFFRQPVHTAAITTSAAAEHPAEDQASNQPGEHVGDEQKGGSHPELHGRNLTAPSAFTSSPEAPADELSAFTH